MRRTNHSISWLEIIILDLAAILAIGAMGASRDMPRASDGATSQVAVVASR
jgi:hypothetical protein